MPQSTGKTTIGVTVTNEIRDDAKRIADLKHWSVSRTLGLFIDAYWEQWKSDLGIEPEKPSTPKTSKKKSVS